MKYPVNYAENKDIAKRAIEFVKPLYDSVVSNRSDLDIQWMRFYNMWRVKVDIRYYRGQSNIYLPVLRKATEDGVNNLSSKLFPTDDNFATRPMPSVPEEYAEAVKIISSYRLYHDLKIKTYIKPILRWLLILGTTAAKHIYDIERKRHRLKPLDILNDFHVYPETADTVDDALVTFETMAVDKFELLRLENLKYVNVQELLTKPVKSAPERLNYGKKPHGINEQRFEALPIWDIIECYTYFDIKKDQKPVPVVISFNPENAIAIQITENTLRDPDGQPYKPYTSCPFIKTPKYFYGHSIYEAGQRLQYALNDFANQVSDNAMYTLNPITLVDMNQVNNPKSLVIKPNAKWDVADPNQTVKFDRPASILGEGLAVVEGIKFWLEQQANIGGLMPMTGKTMTATEISKYSELMGIFIGSTVTDVEENFMLQTLQKHYWLDRQFLPEAEFARILGAKASDIQGLEESGRKVMKNDYSMEWLGSVQSMNIHVKSAQMQNFIDLASRIPKMPDDDYKVNFKHLLRKAYSEGLGQRDAEIAIKDSTTPMIDPDYENKLMLDGKEVEVNENDDDMEHGVSHDTASRDVKDKAIKRIFVRHAHKHIIQHRNKLQQYNARVSMNQLNAIQGKLLGGAKGQGQAPGPKPPTTTGEVIGPVMEQAGIRGRQPEL